MSNVVKMPVKENKPEEFETWREEIDEQNDRMVSRIFDAIRLADDEAIDAGIPEHIADRAILGVLGSLLIDTACTRNIVSPSGLLRFVKCQIKKGDDE